MSDDEIKAALQQILSYCRGRKLKKNQDIFDRVARIIGEDWGEHSDAQTVPRTNREKYRAAVSVLIDLADPPAQDVLDNALERLGKACEMRLQDVRLLDDAAGEYSLRETLPQRRPLSAADHELLDGLRQELRELGPTGWSRGPFADGNEGRNG